MAELDDTSGFRSALVLYVNGVRHEVADADPDMTLLEYLRSPAVALPGTKLGCGEGGCGACTVMVSCWDAAASCARHASVNACLAPLCACDWCAVTTVEGIGAVDGLHPIQKRLVALHGSQCGFCTPGIVMALYSHLEVKEGRP